jgi:hypothetical protein
VHEISGSTEPCSLATAPSPVAGRLRDHHSDIMALCVYAGGSVQEREQAAQAVHGAGMKLIIGVYSSWQDYEDVHDHYRAPDQHLKQLEEQFKEVRTCGAPTRAAPCRSEDVSGITSVGEAVSGVNLILRDDAHKRQVTWARSTSTRTAAVMPGATRRAWTSSAASWTYRCLSLPITFTAGSACLTA